MSFEGWALQMYSMQDASGLNAGINDFHNLIYKLKLFNA